MGCLVSKEASPEDQTHAAIDKQLRLDKKRHARTVKILLLGAGDSGKSTVIKQMRILHEGGFQELERIDMRATIYANLIDAYHILSHIMDTKNIPYESDRARESAGLLRDLPSLCSSDEAFSDSAVKDAVQAMWEDEGVHQALGHGRDYALHDNVVYYSNSIDRFFEPGWLPNNVDILHARARTTGTTEAFFDLSRMTFHMVDVGGQRSERKKWIHCFEGVQCLMFLAALSGYDQCLVEDQSANQMLESMMLFESLANGEWFRNKPIILFLNKDDLFRAKISHSPVPTHLFADFQGPRNDYESAATFFAWRFQSIALSRVPERELYIHRTNATDTTLLKRTMSSVQDILIQDKLNRLVL